MRRHLAEARLSHMEGAVIEELGRVREELGWPIVMTPFAQMLLTQAVMNVTGKERYAVIPDEVIRYAHGPLRHGPTCRSTRKVMDRIDVAAAHAESCGRSRPWRRSPELRRRHRRAACRTRSSCCARRCRPNLVDAMQAAGPAARHYNPALRPVMSLLRQLTARRDLSHICVEKPGFRLELRRHAGASSQALPS